MGVCGGLGLVILFSEVLDCVPGVLFAGDEGTVLVEVPVAVGFD